MIDKSEVVSVNGIYVSALYKDWYAAEFVVLIKKKFFRIRYPYNIYERAKQTVLYLQGKAEKYPLPDYKPMIHMLENGRVK